MLSLIERWLKTSAHETQEYVHLTAAAFYGVFTRPFYRHDIVEQFDQIGAGSLTVVLLAGLFTGAALASQSGLTLDQFGARPVVGRLVSASMIKELGPVLTALMLTGRIGSGIAAEIGSMVVTDQINALRALGTLFGGATAFPQGKGVWRDDAQGGKLLFDEPVVNQCYTSEQAVERQVAKLREFLHRMGREAKQGGDRPGDRPRLPGDQLPAGGDAIAAAERQEARE